jgi:chaperonin GroES
MSKKVEFPITPLNDRVIVEPLEEKVKTTPGGIVIPESAQEKPQLAKVVAVGPGKMGDDNERIPLEVKIGDHIFHSKYGGTMIKYEGKEYIILREDDILAKIQ